jgi:hypothetical protein
MERGESDRASGAERSARTTVSAPIAFNRASISFCPCQVTPPGVKRNTGKLRSTIAMGPWRKSADEKRSATT